MPELPEVEIMSSNVRRWTDGRGVVRLVVDDPTVVVSGVGEVAAVAASAKSVLRLMMHVFPHCCQA